MADIAELSIGTHVFVMDAPYGLTMEGEVIAMQDEAEHPGKLIGVKLNQHAPIAHTCDGICDDGYGWWTRPEKVTVIS